MLKRVMWIYLIMGLTLLFALEEAKIKTEMNQKIQTITTLLQDKALSQEQKEQRIYTIVDPIFSYETMSQISLGRAWGDCTAKQKAAFIAKFEQKLKASYFEKLELYTDEQVVVKSISKPKPNRIQLYTDIVGKEETYEVIYKFYLDKSHNDWLIYDVDITGVSIIQTYRKQFAEFLKTKTVDALIESL